MSPPSVFLALSVSARRIDPVAFLKKVRTLFGPVDMTSGNLFVKMGLFALPVALTTMLQLLYTSIDLITVHIGESAEAMGSIASNGALINLIIVVFSGMALGANVVLAESKGANNPQKAEKVIHSSLLFALMTGIGVGVVGFFVSDNLLQMMNTEEHYMELATLYLRIYFCGLPFLMVYNYCAQLLRAQGDSQSPFLILVASGIVNVAIDCALVFGAHLGVAGVGWATVAAEGVSAILGILFLAKGKRAFVRFSFKKLKIDGSALAEVIRIGLPTGLQMFFFSLPNVFIQASLYTIDRGNADLENGAVASGNIEGYFHALIDAIGMATMTFVAQNVGAKKAKNIRNCVLFGFAWGAMVCALVALVAGTLYRPLLQLFVDTDAAIESGKTRLWIMAFFYLLNAGMNISAGALRGIKKAVFPMMTTLIFCTVLRIILIKTVFPLPEFHTLAWLYALYPITWGLTAVFNAVAIAFAYPKALKKIDQGISVEEEPAAEEQSH